MMLLDSYRRDQRGASAAEFALVVPLFLLLVLGVIHMSMAMYAVVRLHDATEYTARCLAVSANNPAGTPSANMACPNSANVQTYGSGRYSGPKITPTFVLVNATLCANTKQVKGTGTYRLALGLVNLPISITAKACFPSS